MEYGYWGGGKEIIMAAWFWMVLLLDIQYICEWKVFKKVIWHPCEKEVKTSASRGQHWPWYVGLCQLDIGFSPVVNTTCENRVWMMQSNWSLQALIWMVLHVFSQFTRLSDTKLLRLTIMFTWTARLYNILICQCFNYRVAFAKGN